MADREREREKITNCWLGFRSVVLKEPAASLGCAFVSFLFYAINTVGYLDWVATGTFLTFVTTSSSLYERP